MSAWVGDLLNCRCQLSLSVSCHLGEGTLNSKYSVVSLSHSAVCVGRVSHYLWNGWNMTWNSSCPVSFSFTHSALSVGIGFVVEPRQDQ